MLTTGSKKRQQGLSNCRAWRAVLHPARNLNCLGNGRISGNSQAGDAHLQTVSQDEESYLAFSEMNSF